MALGSLKVVGANATTAFLKVHHDQPQSPRGDRTPVLSGCRILCTNTGDTERACDHYTCGSHGPGRCDFNAKETRSQKACREKASQGQRCQEGHACRICRQISDALTKGLRVLSPFLRLPHPASEKLPGSTRFGRLLGFTLGILGAARGRLGKAADSERLGAESANSSNTPNI